VARSACSRGRMTGQLLALLWLPNAGDTGLPKLALRNISWEWRMSGSIRTMGEQVSKCFSGVIPCDRSTRMRFQVLPTFQWLIFEESAKQGKGGDRRRMPVMGRNGRCGRNVKARPRSRLFRIVGVGVERNSEARLRSSSRAARVVRNCVRAHGIMRLVGVGFQVRRDRGGGGVVQFNLTGFG